MASRLNFDRNTSTRNPRHTMHHDLKMFIRSLLWAVIPTLFLVASTAFITIPFALGHHPGDSVTALDASARHMT